MATHCSTEHLGGMTDCDSSLPWGRGSSWGLSPTTTHQTRQTRIPPDFVFHRKGGPRSKFPSGMAGSGILNLKGTGVNAT